MCCGWHRPGRMTRLAWAGCRIKRSGTGWIFVRCVDEGEASLLVDDPGFLRLEAASPANGRPRTRASHKPHGHPLAVGSASTAHIVWIGETHMMNHARLTPIVSALIALVVSSFTVVAGAQDSEEHERLTREMAAYALNNGMFEVIQNQAIEAAFQSARGFLEVGGTTLSETDLQAARTALAAPWRCVFPVEYWVDGYATIYRDNFTAVQIAAILEFYQSPLGRLWLEKTGAIATAGSAFAEALVASRMAEFQNALVEELSR